MTRRAASSCSKSRSSRRIVPDAPLMNRAAYRRSGVDVEAGERAVDLIRGHVESTRRPESVGGLGGFGGGFTIPASYREPLMIASTDGVGTKTAIAAAVRRFDTIGIDLVAMCADDVVCAGAEPLAFLDYVAVGVLDPVDVAELVAGVAAGCREVGAALVGGETAEHPGVLEANEFDLAGCCIGVVERSRVIDGSAAVPGDVILGLASSEGLADVAHERHGEAARHQRDDCKFRKGDEALQAHAVRAKEARCRDRLGKNIELGNHAAGRLPDSAGQDRRAGRALGRVEHVARHRLSHDRTAAGPAQRRQNLPT